MLNAPHSSSVPPSLDAALLEDVHRTWDALADFGAEHAADAATHLMTFLCDRTGAWNATWAGPIRIDAEHKDDPLQGWRVGAMQSLHAIAPHPDDGHFKEILKMLDRREMDPSFLLPIRGMGRFCTYSFRRDLPEAWFHSAFYELHYGSVGIADAAFVAFPINQDCESHFGFYAGKTFTDAQIALLVYALRGLKWFHRRLVLGQGLLLASRPLTPVERNVLHLLLTDATEKRIAGLTGMTPQTIHQYVVSIYRKFGVHSRAGLMSLWLKKGG